MLLCLCQRFYKNFSTALITSMRVFTVKKVYALMVGEAAIRVFEGNRWTGIMVSEVGLGRNKTCKK